MIVNLLDMRKSCSRKMLIKLVIPALSFFGASGIAL